MLTYPQFRGHGYGLQVVSTGKALIERSGADVAIFHSRLHGFYERAGFIPMPRMTTLVGDPAAPTVASETAFMLFLTPKGRAGRAAFATKPLYFGAVTW